MNMSLRGALVLPGTARHIVPEAERVGGQVCRSSLYVEIGRLLREEHPRNDMIRIAEDLTCQVFFFKVIL